MKMGGLTTLKTLSPICNHMAQTLFESYISPNMSPYVSSNMSPCISPNMSPCVSPKMSPNISP